MIDSLMRWEFEVVLMLEYIGQVMIFWWELLSWVRLVLFRHELVEIFRRDCEAL